MSKQEDGRLLILDDTERASALDDLSARARCGEDIRWNEVSEVIARAQWEADEARYAKLAGVPDEQLVAGIHEIIEYLINDGICDEGSAKAFIPQMSVQIIALIAPICAAQKAEAVAAERKRILDTLREAYPAITVWPCWKELEAK